MDEIDRRWKELCQSNAEYFDGRLYHVIGVHRNGHGGAVLHVIDCAYRFFAVQDEQFDLGVRGLGVKGITTCSYRVLLGLRSPTVAFYRNTWEFAPGGSVSPGLDPHEVIRAELMEETNLRAVGEPIATAVMFDPVLRCWEIVYRMSVHDDSLRAQPTEYRDLQWRNPNDLPSPLSPIAQQIAHLL